MKCNSFHIQVTDNIILIPTTWKKYQQSHKRPMVTTVVIINQEIQEIETLLQVCYLKITIAFNTKV